MSEELRPESALSRHESYFYDLWLNHSDGITKAMATVGLLGISGVLKDMADDGVTLPDGSNFVIYESLSKAVFDDQVEDCLKARTVDNIDAITQIRCKASGFEIDGSPRKFIWGVEIQLAGQPHYALGMGLDGLVYSYEARVGQGEPEEFESPLENGYSMTATSLCMFINPKVFMTQI